MENASKALIIAGSILLSILIIALGMYIFSQSGSATDTSQLSALEVSAFNSKFDKYKGSQNGSQVTALLDAVIANARVNEGKSERPTVEFWAENAKKATTLAKGSDVDKAADENGKGATTGYINKVKSIKDSIESSHIYYITMTENADSDLINSITIKYTK